MLKFQAPDVQRARRLRPTIPSLYGPYNDPDLVLLVDAAELGERPGALRWLHWSETSGLSASTHTLPPYLLARYLTQELGCEVALLGIQPENTWPGAPVSPAVREAIGQIVAVLAHNV